MYIAAGLCRALHRTAPAKGQLGSLREESSRDGSFEVTVSIILRYKLDPTSALPVLFILDCTKSEELAP